MPTAPATGEISTGGGNESDFAHAGTLVQAVTNESQYNWTVEVDFYGDYLINDRGIARTEHGLIGAASNLPMSAYMYDPLYVYWNSGNALLDPYSEIGGSSHLINADTTGNFSVNVIISDPSGHQNVETFFRPLNTDMAIGLNAGQVTNQYVSILQSETNFVEQTVDNNSGLTFDQFDISRVLALSTYTYFSETDEAQTVANNLFQTIRGYGNPTLAVASCSQSLETVNDSRQLPNLPQNLTISVPLIGDDPISINPDAHNKQQSFALIAISFSSLESELWQQLANNDAYSTVRGLQLANEVGVTVTAMTQSNWNQATWKSALTAGEQSAIQTAFTDGASEIITPENDYKLGGLDWVGFYAVTLNQGNVTVGIHAVIADQNGDSYLGGATNIFTTPADPQSAPGQTFIGPNSTAASAGVVNGANGALLLNVTDINVPTAGLALTFSRHYDSTTKGQTNLSNTLTLGDSWWGTYADRVSAGSGTSINWTNGDGVVLNFTNPSSGLYQNPVAVFGEFRKNSDGTYQFTDKNGLTYKFRSLTGSNPGVLFEIRDLHGNELVITPNGNGLPSTVQSKPAGSASSVAQLTFSYGTNSQLTKIEVDTATTTRTWTYSVAVVNSTNDELNEVTSPTDPTSGDTLEYAYTYIASPVPNATPAFLLF
ncbi:MAG TPA: DUF6531 domain-containing protein [Pirellulales bacterium]|nr:DUF6531 domain-containing protein [Pirellulales bacterium]